MKPGPRPALVLALPALAAALLLLAQPVVAQQEAPKSDGMERAQKAADAVFHWIKLHADKGTPKPQPAPAPAPTPKKPAPAPTPVAAAPRPAPAPATAAPAPTPTPVAVAAAAPAVSAVAMAEPEPDPVPVALAAAVPTPVPGAPLPAAAQAVEAASQTAAEEEPEEPLRLLSKVDPAMPRQMQRNGYAQVQFTVAPDGSVQQASIVKTSHARLGNAAVEAVRQWRFAPLRKARDAAVEIAFKNNDGD